MRANLFDVLTAASADRGNHPFLFSGSGHVTYDGIKHRAGQFATAMHDVGVAPGDRVVVQIDKSTDAVALYLATLQLGAVYVPLNSALAREELAFFVDDADPALVIRAPAAEPVPVAAPVMTVGAHRSGTLSAEADEAAPMTGRSDRSGSDIAAMLYTSGTTGRAKGAMLTHRGLIANARALTDIWGFAADDMLVHSLPIFHVHGLFVALHCPMLSASSVRFLERFDAGAVIDALDGATVMMGVPTHYTRLLESPDLDERTCRTMRLFTSGSAPMTAQLHERFRQRTGHRILERYGMTETGIISSNPLDGERVAGTVGFALPEMELRVATEDGPCAPGAIGVVEVRGPHLFSGYWNLPDTTAAEFRSDGFFVTGDVGSVDEQGRLRLEGRAGDMIISGGENIYPKEVELCLDDAPGIIESAVVGLAHPDLGEAVTAFVVATAELDNAAMAEHLGSRLARFKHPRAYVSVEELPRNTMGKVRKDILRRDHASFFGSLPDGSSGSGSDG